MSNYLVKCPVCGNQVSSGAARCPRCGEKMHDCKMRCKSLGIAGVIVAILPIVVMYAVDAVGGHFPPGALMFFELVSLLMMLIGFSSRTA